MTEGRTAPGGSSTGFEDTWYENRDIEAAWQLLPGGPDYQEQGEVWQYMGSRLDRAKGKAIHTFRHRVYGGARRYVNVIDDERGVSLAPANEMRAE